MLQKPVHVAFPAIPSAAGLVYRIVASLQPRSARPIRNRSCLINFHCKELKTFARG